MDKIALCCFHPDILKCEKNMYLNKNMMILYCVLDVFSIFCILQMDYNIKHLVMKAHLFLRCSPSICLSMHDFLGSAFRGQVTKEVLMVKCEVHLSHIYSGTNVFIGYLWSHMQYQRGYGMQSKFLTSS